MRNISNISIQLSDNISNNVSGINRNSSSRGSIRISPPIVPISDSKPILRTNSSNVMKTDLETQPFNQTLNQTSASIQNNLMATNCNDLRLQMSNLSHQYYDSNNYLSNKCQQINKNQNPIAISQPVMGGMGATNVCLASGHSTSTSTTAVVNNGITSANLNIKSISNSRGSLEDHGVDVGRVSPSTSSNDSRKSRYSTASLDSGRGSDTKTSVQSHRVSVHSCESLGSQSSNKDNYNRNSSSSSSIGSGNSISLEGDITATSAPTTPVSVGHSITGPLSIPEMVLHGIADEEIIYSWLSRIHFEEYANNFIKAGYDMPTISRMTPEDLTAIGITKPGKRQTLKTEIQRLTIADGIPNFKPNSLLEWLKILRLDEYFTTLCQQGYDSIDRVTELAWEDLEEVGIRKLGHQKKIMLAIKRIQSVNNNTSRFSVSNNSSNNLTLPLVYNNTTPCSDILTRPLNNSYQMSVNTQFQDTVPIKMFAPTKSTPSPTTEKPITPQLKTFQQLPINGINGYLFRQRSEDPYYGLVSNDGQSSVFQSSRGRSLESLDNSESNYYQMYCGKQRHVFNGFPKQTQFSDNDLSHLRDSDQIHGYETDSELHNSYSNNRKFSYEIDGTATLHRPKGLIKAKPIAKIVAKTRQTDPNSFNHQIYCNEPQKDSSIDKRYEPLPQTENNLQNNYTICDDIESNNYFQDMSSQLYSSLKRKKTPPPPPKRGNSMRNNSANSSPLYAGHNSPNLSSFSPSHRESYDEFQEQVFATCVKSLTSRFSINNNSDDLNGRQSKDNVDYSNDFPPPPSPLSFNECQNYNTLERRKDKSIDRECNISSSSSTESMPFANDNIGTIKQRVNNELTHREMPSPSSSFTSFTSSAPSSMTTSPSSGAPPLITNSIIISQDISNKNSDSKLFMKGLSQTKHNFDSYEDNDRMTVRRVSPESRQPIVQVPRVDALDDIETMLANLSNQLDLMLENDNKHNNRNK